MAKKGTRYPAEFRRQMVELVLAGRAYAELAREFGPTDWTIRKWVKQAEREVKRGDAGLSTNEREELLRLRRDNRQLKLEREILSKAAAWFANESNATPKRSSGS
jgi:transposase